MNMLHGFVAAFTALQALVRRPSSQAARVARHPSAPAYPHVHPGLAQLRCSIFDAPANRRPPSRSEWHRDFPASRR
jgi:hypothetical protein